jgi:hypothetical protein
MLTSFTMMEMHYIHSIAELEQYNHIDFLQDLDA